jgi:hypothetical protein
LTTFSQKDDSDNNNLNLITSNKLIVIVQSLIVVTDVIAVTEHTIQNQNSWCNLRTNQQQLRLKRFDDCAILIAWLSRSVKVLQGKILTNNNM